MTSKFVWALILMVVLAGPVLAADAFHVGYRQENVVAEGNSVTGNLLVSVYNVSGAEARDITVSFPGPNNVTYDNRPVFIGNLADGQRVEVLDIFSVPVEMRQSDKAEEQIGVDVEFTTAPGERKSVRVTGRNFQINN